MPAGTVPPVRHARAFRPMAGAMGGRIVHRWSNVPTAYARFAPLRAIRPPAVWACGQRGITLNSNFFRTMYQASRISAEWVAKPIQALPQSTPGIDAIASAKNTCQTNT